MQNPRITGPPQATPSSSSSMALRSTSTSMVPASGSSHSIMTAVIPRLQVPYTPWGLDQNWAYEQRLPGPSHSAQATTLWRLQSSEHTAEAMLVVRDRALSSGNTSKLFFYIDVDPYCHAFVLALRLRPFPDKKLAKDYDHNKAIEAYYRDTAYYIFQTFTRSGDPVGKNRVPFAFPLPPDQQPRGPIDFSSSLYEVKYAPYAESGLFHSGDRPVKVEKELNWKDITKCRLHCWKGKKTWPMQIGTLVDPSTLPPDSAQSLAKFNQMMNAAIDGDLEIQVITEMAPKLNHVWPRFCSLPMPQPASYWPWLKANPQNPDDVFDQTKSNFEIYPDYNKKALGVRDPNWWHTKAGNKTVTPENASIVIPKKGILALPRTVHFRDGRHYLAFILGCEVYETQFSKSQADDKFDGQHWCMIAKTPNSAVTDYTVLMSIRIEEKPHTEGLLPPIGERVDMGVGWSDAAAEEWVGSVIKMSPALAHLGHNVAISATRPPFAGGQVINDWLHKQVFFKFGHVGQNVGSLRQRLSRVMMDHGDQELTQSEKWLKRLLLARENTDPRLNATKDNSNLSEPPSNWKAIIQEAIDKHKLNKEQAEAVWHVYQHRLTIVVGPPGTGKSKVATVILELEDTFKQKWWVNTGSNAALDLLTTRYCVDRRYKHPYMVYRLQPGFLETVGDSFDPGDRPASWVPASDLAAAVPGPPLVSVHGTQPFQGSNSLAALEQTIRSRYKLWREKGANFVEIVKGEKGLLAEFMTYRLMIKGVRLNIDPEHDDPDHDRTQDLTTRELEEQRKANMITESQLRKRDRDCLRRLQSTYICAARGIFTTASNAASGLLGGFHPNLVLLDEGSQMLEAEAVHPFLRAARGKHAQLNRIVIFGDTDQLPPTIVNPNNPFRAQGALSLMERLILSGIKPLRLRTQYRMHPSISLPINRAMYNNQLLNGSNTDDTTARPGILAFRSWLSNYAQRILKKSDYQAEKNAVMFSPVQLATGPKWGSMKHSGSNSKINPHTAMIVVLAALSLTNRSQGKFAAKNIMIACFYAAQLQLIKAACRCHKQLDDIRFFTVDSAQGEESDVVIVDFVTLGHGARESMGFLGDETRRPNVALSRAKVGLIVVGHRDFHKGNPGSQAKEKLGKVPFWSDYIGYFEQEDLIIDYPDTIVWGDDRDSKRALKIIQEFAKKEVAPQAAAAPVARVRHQIPEQQYNMGRFCEVTGADHTEATQYLQRYDGQLNVAINAFFQGQASLGVDETKGDDTIVDLEEVGRIQKLID